MVRTTVAVMACLVLLAGLGACAGKKTAPTSVDAVFIRYDANKDGKITKEEFVATVKDKQKAETAWKKIDSKNNGFVDRTLANETPLNVWSDVESQDTPY